MGSGTINSRASAVFTQSAVVEQTAGMEELLTQLASGKRATTAEEDAAAVALSDKLNSDAKQLSQGVRNINEGINLVNVADEAVQELQGILGKLKSLAERGETTALSAAERTVLNEEAQQLADEYLRVARSAEYNDRELFTGEFETLSIQAGVNEYGDIVEGLGGSSFNGTFALDSALNAPVAPRIEANGSVAGDLNGDGYIDLVVTGDGTPESMVISSGSSAGLTVTGVYTSVADSLAEVTLGDIDNDGDLDIVAAGNTAGVGEINIYTNDGTGVFSAATSVSMNTAGSNEIQLADLNGDGNLDVITSGAAIGAQPDLAIRFGDGTGSFGAMTTYTFAGAGTSSDGLSVGDIDNDGDLDFAAYEVGGGTSLVQVFENDGIGNFTKTTSFSGAINTVDAQFGDIDNDGNLDIITTGTAVPGLVLNVRYGDGAGSFTDSYTESGATAFNPFSSELADLNNDGYEDIVIASQNTISGDYGLYYALNDGAGEFSLDAFNFFDANLDTINGSQISVADFNNDSVLDVAQTGEFSTFGWARVLYGETQNGISALNSFTLETAAESRQATLRFANSQQVLEVQQGQIDGFRGRLESAFNAAQQTAALTYEAGERVTDIDAAKTLSEFVAQELQANVSYAIFAQANLNPSRVTELLDSIA